MTCKYNCNFIVIKKNPVFEINIIYRNEKLQLLPSYRRLRDCFVFIYETLNNLTLYLIRIEHILYENHCSTDIFLKVRI